MVEQRGGKRRVVIEDFRPVLERAIGAHEDGAALVTLGDDLEQQVGTELVDREISASSSTTNNFGLRYRCIVRFREPVAAAADSVWMISIAVVNGTE